MNFSQRSFNFLMKVFTTIIMSCHTWYTDRVLRKIFPDGNVPSSWQMLADINGVLINTNNVLDYPRLQPETYVNVGGMQIAEKPRPLPQVSMHILATVCSVRECLNWFCDKKVETNSSVAKYMFARIHSHEVTQL